MRALPPRVLLAGCLLLLICFLPPCREQVVEPLADSTFVHLRALLEGRPLRGLPAAQLRSLQVSLEQQMLELQLQQLKSTDSALNPVEAEEDQALLRQLAQTRQELLWIRLGNHPGWMGVLLFGGGLGLFLASRRRLLTGGEETNAPSEATETPVSSHDLYASMPQDVQRSASAASGNPETPARPLNPRVSHPTPPAEALDLSPAPQLMFIEADLHRIEQDTAIPKTDAHGLPISLELPTFDSDALAAALLDPQAQKPRRRWSDLVTRALPARDLEALLKSCTRRLSKGSDYDYPNDEHPGDGSPGFDHIALLGLLSQQLAWREGQLMTIQPAPEPRTSGQLRIRFTTGTEVEELSGLTTADYARLVASLSSRLGFDGRSVSLMMPGPRGFQLQRLTLDDTGLTLEVLTTCALPLD